jgi:PPM family protein phosphatase
VGDTGELPLAEADDGEGAVQIRTRQETGTNWADGMRRFGAPQGRDRRQVEGTGGGRRVLAGLLAVAVLLALLAGGGWLLLSRAYFVGVHDGEVAVFRGVPQTVANVELFRVEELSGLDVEDLAAHRQRRLEDGVSVGSIAEGRRLVADLQREAATPDDPDGDAP